MAWKLEFTEEYEEWFDGLSSAQQENVDAVVGRLADRGPLLDYPHSSDIRGSRHGGMRELRTQSAGRPLRVFYAFDPRRSAILLIGGVKTDNRRFYRRYVRLADRLYDRHLQRLRQKGLIR